MYLDVIWGKTSLAIAAEEGNTDRVRILLEHGADVNTKDERGKLHTLSQYLSNHPSIYIYVIKI